MSYSTTVTSSNVIVTSAVAVSFAAAAWMLYNRRSSNADDDHADTFHNDKTMERQESISIEQLSREELLERFPSLRSAFSQSPMVGLYFCAGWCSDCQLATPSLRRVLQSDANDDAALTVLYVSSDYDAKQLQAFKPSCMSHIDFANVSERAALKKHFGVCAAKEQRDIQITHRRHGVPTLLLLESATGRVLTERGVDHCLQSGSSADQVLDGWRRMLGDVAATGDDSFDGVSMMHDLMNASKSNLS
ncbi:hypothetical protein MPSEU_000831700 [Mayamaea pseudoterrestris]|nr:hypothetical protein MPSEU_000831700 [Mayamaea pseudoterrestris]